MIFSISKAVLFIDDEVFGVSLNVKFFVKAAFKSPDRFPDANDFRALLRNECRRFDDILSLSESLEKFLDFFFVFVCVFKIYPLIGQMRQKVPNFLYFKEIAKFVGILNDQH